MRTRATCDAMTFGARCELREHAPDVAHCGWALAFGRWDVVSWTDADDARELARGDWGPGEDEARARFAATIRGRFRTARAQLVVCAVSWETVPLIP